MKRDNYKIEYTFSSRDDMRKMKKYILDTFKYRELGENFTKKMKEASEGLKTLPTGFDTVGFQYRGYDIHLKPYRTYLFFYVGQSFFLWGNDPVHAHYILKVA